MRGSRVVCLPGRPKVGRRIQHLPQLGVPVQGTAEPLPFLGPAGAIPSPDPSGPGPPGPKAQNHRHPRALPAWAAKLCQVPAAATLPGGPQPSRGPGPPRAARPTAGRPRTVWDCRLWLASMAAVSGTVSSSSTLPTGGFSIKAIPGRPSATSSGPGAGTRGADSCRPPGSAAAAAVNTHRPTRRRHPPGPRGPNADRPPPRSLSILAALRAAASRGVLAPNFRIHRCAGPAPPKSSRSHRKPCILSTRPKIRGHFTLSHHP